MIRLLVIPFMLAVSAAPAVAASCSFGPVITAESDGAAIAARYVEVLKDDVVFVAADGALSEGDSLQLKAGDFVPGATSRIALVANRACSRDLLQDVERIAASALNRWQERAVRFDEVGQYRPVAVSVEMAIPER